MNGRRRGERRREKHRALRTGLLGVSLPRGIPGAPRSGRAGKPLPVIPVRPGPASGRKSGGRGCPSGSDSGREVCLPNGARQRGGRTEAGPEQLGTGWAHGCPRQHLRQPRGLPAPLGAPPERTCPGWHQLAQATVPCRSPRGTTVRASEGRAIGGLRRGASVSMATASSSGGARRWPREMMLRTWAGPKGWAVPTGCQQRAGSPRSAATPVTTARAPRSAASPAGLRSPVCCVIPFTLPREGWPAALPLG